MLKTNQEQQPIWSANAVHARTNPILSGMMGDVRGIRLGHEKSLFNSAAFWLQNAVPYVNRIFLNFIVNRILPIFRLKPEYSVHVTLLTDHSNPFSCQPLE